MPNRPTGDKSFAVLTKYAFTNERERERDGAGRRFVVL